MVTKVFFFLEQLYVLLHAAGACASGYMNPSTNQATKDDCRNNCKARVAGYFSYHDDTSDCTCYTVEAGCPLLDTVEEQNSYRILESKAFV